MTYEQVASITQVGALVGFVAMFVGVLVYAFWPGNKKRFEASGEAALGERSGARRREGRLDAMASLKHDRAPESETTGHEWDGIRELNKPLPKWWLWTFYATIVWAIGYWLLMPAWPLVASYTTGWLGYSSRERVAEQLEAANAAKAEYRQKIAASNLAAINSDPELLQFALAGGEAAFGDNCAPCHGRGAQGAFGFPNLRDDSWLWGGTLDAIQQTVQHGIRADDPQTRSAGAQMPAFGKSGVLTEAQIGDVTDYVLSLSGHAGDQQAVGARRQDLRRHLLALSRAGRQGQPSDRCAGFDR